MKSQFAIGIDLGGTKIAAGLVDRRGRVGETLRVATPQRGPASVIAAMGTLVGALLKAAHAEKRNCLGVGVGIPGQVDVARGFINFVPNLGWRNVRFAAQLSRRLRMKVAIDNDVRMAARAEFRYGAARGARDAALLFVGTGIGGALLINGEVILGATGTAGEIGHTVVVENGPRDSCGNRGCLEYYASGTGIARRAAERARERKSSTLHGRRSIVATDVAAAAREGDRLAAEILAETAEYLGAGIASLMNLINPEIVVLGGGVIDGIPELVPMAAECARKRALPAASAGVEIVASQKKGEAGLLGAASLWF